MRFKLDKPRGVFRLAVASEPERILAAAAQGALVQALMEYASGRLPSASPREKFAASAFRRFGFSERSDAYQKRQRKILGQALPFVAPRLGMNFTKAALALTSGSPGAMISALRDLSKNMGPRLRDIITVPGIGWRVNGRPGRRRFTTTITWPGAAKLNTRPQYAAEFRDLRRGGHLKAIQARAAQLYPQYLTDELKKAA